MGTLCSNENLTTKRNRLITELVQGKEYASQLKSMLQKPVGVNGSLSTEELAGKIIRSFSETLSVLTCSDQSGFDEVCQNLTISCENDSPLATSCNDRRSEDSGHSSKRSMANRRGCYKRRKTDETWTVLSHTSEDSHAWRKYGQKEILNSKYPRSYFRCTRKFDQGCKAIKQVQRIEDIPETYQTTYIGHHTCNSMFLKTPQMLTVTDSSFSDPCWESFLVNEHSNHHSIKIPSEQEQPFTLSSSSNQTIKQEYSKEDQTPSDLTDNNFSSLDNNDLWSDLKGFELSEKRAIPSFNNDFHFFESTFL
ncbi:putative WRKY transcription factor [Quillaja saponaria]|uniref:WRKY transcription factor n=1 Tax=Quillaja saponaria TaxID=32244 RepID=A0AAD7LKG6_QUISA|nr:putative WRKY transcription factor [Quillaja saponaria]